MLPHRQLWFLIMLGGLFILVVTIPYLWAYQDTGENYFFGGFLLNPLDGNSYLAKMHQGLQGSWRFHLPYSIEQGDGGYLFVFYLALGHLSRIFDTHIQTVFHLARVTSAFVLVISLWHFYVNVFSNTKARTIAFGLALFGSGLGWLAASFGIFSADFWVAEGYPFLAAYANPHFPLGIALMTWLLTPGSPGTGHFNQGLSALRRGMVAGAGFLLAVILPFGVVIASSVLAGLLVWESWTADQGRAGARTLTRMLGEKIFHSDTGHKLIFLILGGGPILIYQLWVISSDPVLAAWNTQNVTPSPPFWDLLVSYAPILAVALPGAYLAASGKDGRMSFLLTWALLGLVLMYLPWSLQRRFITGYMIPLSGLAAIGIESLFSKKKILGAAAFVMIILLMLPTNLMILLGGVQAVNEKAGLLFLTDDEHQALSWLENNTPGEAVILASPQMGLFIPAYSGRRVLYGHPYETVNAVQRENQVLDYFSGTGGEDADADFLFYGPRERGLGEIAPQLDHDLIYEAGGVQIYRIE
jgi:hypothetical protein